MLKRAIALLLFVPMVCMAQTVVLSHRGGFCADTFSLAVASTAMPDGTSLRYTLNGSVPTMAAAEYSGPIAIGEASLSPSNIFLIQNCIDTHWRVLPDVERIVVVRAALVDSANRLRSAVATAAYVLEPLLGRAMQLPVVSLCADSASLFDYDTGIFVRGRHYDPSHPCCTGNYFQRGREWERRANMAFITRDGIFSRDCGLRIHGNSQRTLGQKGFSLYARQEYGAKRFDYPFFANRRQTACKRLTLRPWCSSWSGAGIEDWLAQQLAEPMQCDNLASRPVALFLNGEYWGIYFLEEKPDEHYVEEHYGTDHDYVDLLSYWDGAIESGSADRWLRLYDWLKTADLTADSAYATLKAQVDLSALTDYMLMQAASANVDWPANNVRFFSAAGAPWRWIFFDADASFAPWRDNYEMLRYITCNDSSMSYPSSPSASLLFRRLLERADFKMAAFRRLRWMVDGPWSYDRASAVVDSAIGLLAPEVEHQIARFPKPATVTDWVQAVGDIKNYFLWNVQSLPTDFAGFFSFAYSRSYRLAPNPSVGKARLAYDVPRNVSVRIGIADIQGREAAGFEANLMAGRGTIDLPRLPRGVYAVSIEGEAQPLLWIVAQ